MPWRDAQALHIYVPTEEPYGSNWVEQVLGEVIRPIFEQHKKGIRWLWVGRYMGPYNEEKPPPPYDDGSPPPPGGYIPERYRSDGNYRFVLFRISARRKYKQTLLGQTLHWAKGADCWAYPPGWKEYDVVQNLGIHEDRFIQAGADPKKRANRAKLIAYFMDATAKLRLDSLVQDAQGRWSIEGNSNHEENPNGSFFESVHHLFCNATRAPTTVLLSAKSNQLTLGTFWPPGLLSISHREGDFPQKNWGDFISSWKIISFDEFVGKPIRLAERPFPIYAAQTKDGEILFAELPLFY